MIHSLCSDVNKLIMDFLPPDDAINYVNVINELRSKKTAIINDLAKETFGHLVFETSSFNLRSLCHLLHYSQNYPDISKNHAVVIRNLKPGYFEGLKSFIGIQNLQEEFIKNDYNEKLSLLDSYKPQTILQLRNRLWTYWHIDRIIIDYKEAIDKERDETLNQASRIHSLFLRCSALVFGYFFKKEPLSSVNQLRMRSSDNYVKIGAFSNEGQNYDVIAMHFFAEYSTGSSRRLISRYNGDTCIAIMKEGDEPDLFMMHLEQCLCVSLRYKTMTLGFENNSQYKKYLSEHAFSHNRLLGCKSEPVLFGDFLYTNQTRDSLGSNRLLDRKLTQIFIELFLQQKNITKLVARSCDDDIFILASSGLAEHCLSSNFKSSNLSKVKSIISDFRQNSSNQLYPPYSRAFSFYPHNVAYGSYNFEFTKNQVHEPNVWYTRDVNHMQSWNEIITSDPILFEGAAILPQYWGKNLVHG